MSNPVLLERRAAALAGMYARPLTGRCRWAYTGLCGTYVKEARFCPRHERTANLLRRTLRERGAL